MSGTTEAFARVKIDALLRDAGWDLSDGSSMLFEEALTDGTQAHYVLCDRQGRPVAVLETNCAGLAPVVAQDQGKRYAEQLRVRRDFSTVPTDRKIVDRDYRIECPGALSAELDLGRRKLSVELATGTGKTRTAAAVVKRLFGASIVIRVLFLVDRIALARQAEDAFTGHLREFHGKWSSVLRHFGVIQLGLTATPCTVAAEALPESGSVRRSKLWRSGNSVEHTRGGDEGPRRAAGSPLDVESPPKGARTCRD